MWDYDSVLATLAGSHAERTELMKIGTILLAGAVLMSPGVVLAQAGPVSSADKTTKTDAVKVPRSQAATARVNDTDRFINDEEKRIDHMMAICTGC